MTSLEQLSLAEFSGELTRPKVYQNGHKMFPGFGWIETRRSKFGPIFSDKVHQRLQLSKYVNNKSCSPIFIFFNEKKVRKFRLIFDIEN